MAIDIKFTKFDNTPWGFRLAGGSDFPQPLTVIRVSEGSLAECMGLRVGDVVVRLNDQPVSSYTHGKAHEALILAGNNFSLGVLRDEESEKVVEAIQQKNIVPYNIPLEELPPVYSPEIPAHHTPEPMTDIEAPEAPETPEKLIDPDEEALLSKPTDANSEIVANKNLTDDEIAMLILEEEELLPEQGVLGVNFKKLRPRAPLLKESKVFEELQKIETADPPQVQELKRFTTFLQKPERPPPLPKKVQEEPKGETYRVVIQKQHKKSVTERLAEKGLLGPISSPETRSQVKMNVSGSGASQTARDYLSWYSIIRNCVLLKGFHGARANFKAPLPLKGKKLYFRNRYFDKNISKVRDWILSVKNDLTKSYKTKNKPELHFKSQYPKNYLRKDDAWLNFVKVVASPAYDRFDSASKPRRCVRKAQKLHRRTQYVKNDLNEKAAWICRVKNIIEDKVKSVGNIFVGFKLKSEASKRKLYVKGSYVEKYIAENSKWLQAVKEYVSSHIFKRGRSRRSNFKSKSKTRKSIRERKLHLESRSLQKSVNEVQHAINPVEKCVSENLFLRANIEITKHPDSIEDKYVGFELYLKKGEIFSESVLLRVFDTYVKIKNVIYAEIFHRGSNKSYRKSKNKNLKVSNESVFSWLSFSKTVSSSSSMISSNIDNNESNGVDDIAETISESINYAGKNEAENDVLTAGRRLSFVPTILFEGVTNNIGINFTKVFAYVLIPCASMLLISAYK